MWFCMFRVIDLSVANILSEQYPPELTAFCLLKSAVITAAVVAPQSTFLWSKLAFNSSFFVIYIVLIGSDSAENKYLAEYFKKLNICWN